MLQHLIRMSKKRHYTTVEKKTYTSVNGFSNCFCSLLNLFAPPNSELFCEVGKSSLKK